MCANEQQADGEQEAKSILPEKVVGSQGLRMKDAGQDLLHVSVIPCRHFATSLEAGL